jgi:stage III sporulation protein AH
MKILKKKQWMLVALVAALGLAVYLNFYLVDSPALSSGAGTADKKEDGNLGDATFVGTGVSDPTAAPSYFDEARQKRTTAREEALSILQEVLDNAQTTAQEKEAATREATAIAQRVLAESNIENLITAKGFADAVAYIQEDSCSVVVQAEELQPQQSLQILEIAVSQSGVSPEKVQVTAAKG